MVESLHLFTSPLFFKRLYGYIGTVFYLSIFSLVQAQQSKIADSKQLSTLLQTSTTRYTNWRVLVSDKAEFYKWMVLNAAGCSVDTTSRDRIVMVTSQTKKDLSILQTCPLVIYIDVPNRKAKEERDLDSYDLNLNQIIAAHSLFPEITGQGLVVSVKENPFDKADIDFKDRVVNPDSISSESFTTHATTMASLIAGGGNLSLFSKGAAWQAQLASSSFAELLPDDNNVLKAIGVSVQNHSYGVGIENYYGIESMEYDKQCNQNPSLIHVFSSGNYGDQTPADGPYAGLTGIATLTGQFKQSKNTICVGAVDVYGKKLALSSAGPAYDGRIKPELVAYGDGGTSESSALVSGICLLVQHAYKKYYQDTLPPSSLVKAALINGAEDIGNTGPDFDTGYGNVDAVHAIKMIADGQFYIGKISQSEKMSIPVTLPAGMKKLKITVVWNDLEAEINTTTALVNDIDMELVCVSSGQHWKPWILHTYPSTDSLTLPAYRGEDHLNSVEQITLDNPTPGKYQILLSGYNIQSDTQSFSLVYSWDETTFEWLNPVKESVFQAGKVSNIRWRNVLPETYAVLEFKLAGQTDWQTIAVMEDASAGFFSWTPPDTNAHALFRMSINGASYVSDTVTIFHPINLEVGYQCGKNALLYWTPVKGVSQYQVFRLRDMYLELFKQVTDTLLLLDSTDKDVLSYAIAPIVSGESIGRSVTVNYTQQGVGCYFKSFLARDVVNDTTWLDAELSTIYKLESATLERWDNGYFKRLQTIVIDRVTLSFEDSSAQTGLNLYRIVLHAQGGLDVLSDTVSVYHLDEKRMLLYPNPVKAGEELNIAESESDEAIVEIFDLQGHLLINSITMGAIKTISTSQFAKGVYIVRIQTERGHKITQRLVIL